MSAPLSSLGQLECILPGKVLTPPGHRRQRMRASQRCHPDGSSLSAMASPQNAEEKRADEGSNLAAAVAWVEPPPLPGVPAEEDTGATGSCDAAASRSQRPAVVTMWFPAPSAPSFPPRPAQSQQQQRKSGSSCREAQQQQQGPDADAARREALLPDQPLLRRSGEASEPVVDPSSADAKRLIARCMTHERPTALLQANAAVLNACIARLGEEVLPGEKRSDKIRRMLRLTDELRRYNANLTEQGMPRDSDEEEAGSEAPAREVFVAWQAT